MGGGVRDKKVTAAKGQGPESRAGLQGILGQKNGEEEKRCFLSGNHVPQLKTDLILQRAPQAQAQTTEGASQRFGTFLNFRDKRAFWLPLWREQFKQPPTHLPSLNPSENEVTVQTLDEIQVDSGPPRELGCERAHPCPLHRRQARGRGALTASAWCHGQSYLPPGPAATRSPVSALGHVADVIIQVGLTDPRSPTGWWQGAAVGFGCEGPAANAVF